MSKYTYVKNGVKYEKCVKCLEKTDVKFSKPIHNREHFVEESGQLCRECHGKIYNEEKIV